MNYPMSALQGVTTNISSRFWHDPSASTSLQPAPSKMNAFDINRIIAPQAMNLGNLCIYTASTPQLQGPPNNRGTNQISAPFEPCTLTLAYGNLPGLHANAEGIQRNLYLIGTPSAEDLLWLQLPVGPSAATSLNYAMSLQKIHATAPTPSEATAPTHDHVLETKLRSIFRRATEEHFEDGVESVFARHLGAIARTAKGSSLKESLARLLADPTVAPDAWAEAMRWLGRTSDPIPKENRLWLLENGLTATHASVRDGALLGLASMDDESAIPHIKRALRLEKIKELRSDMEQVLAQLEKR